MKIRNGFVSNSSTSSFLIGFPKQNNYCYYDSSDLHHFLFPDKKYNDMISFSEWSMPLYCVTYVIAKDLQGKKPITTKKAFIKAIYDGGYCGTVGFDIEDNEEVDAILSDFQKKYGVNLLSGKYFNTKEYKLYWKACQKQRKESNRKIYQEALKLAEEKWPIFKKLNSFVVEYGNEEGVVGMIMEANDIFKNIQHIQLHNH